MKGLDISAWQENIDWQAVKNEGIEFIICKLGENYRLDPMFEQHINDAIENGMKVGVYYYTRATNETQAISDANWVDSQIKQYLNGKTPEIGIWYDVEDSSIESTGVDITALCRAFLSELKAYDYVGVYSSYNWLTNGNVDADSLNCPLWIAQYNNSCDFEHPNLKLWQFTDHYSDELPYDGNVLI